MSANILKINTSEFKNGNVIAKSIFSTSGDLIVSKNTYYSPQIKVRLFAFGITHIYIYEDNLIHEDDYSGYANTDDDFDFLNQHNIFESDIDTPSVDSELLSNTAESMDDDIIKKFLAENNGSSFQNAQSNNSKSSSDFFQKDLPRDIQIKVEPFFKPLQKEYIESLYYYKTALKEMIKTNETANIDTEKILSFPQKLIKIKNKYNTYEILQGVRSYDDPIFSHSFNTSIIVGSIGKLLHYNESDLRVLMLSALLHDIGKLFIPIDLLEKPIPISKEEHETIAKHPILGYDFIKNWVIDSRIKSCILLHHERCDGSGYPYGTKADKLPEFVKIMSIADVFDAMVSNRSYRNAHNPFEIIKIFEKDIPKFDSSILYEFLHSIALSYLYCDVILSDGRIGKIIMINESNLSRPLITINNKYIDLSKNYNLSIINII